MEKMVKVLGSSENHLQMLSKNLQNLLRMYKQNQRDKTNYFKCNEVYLNCINSKNTDKRDHAHYYLEWKTLQQTNVVEIFV